MLYRISLFVFSCMLIFSCKKQTKQSEHVSLFNKEKIDEVFKDLPKVLLNHLYVVVDSITYAKLTANDKLKKTYASLDLGLPDFAPVDDCASACYLRGHKHYIEILGPDNQYNEPVGKSGIGFFLKNEGEHFHLGIKPKLRVEQHSLLDASEIVKMPINGKEQTWFKAFYTPNYGTSLHTWYSFYNPNFLNHLHDEQYTSYSREKFLEGVYEDDKLFHSIKAMRLTCTPDDFLRIVNELAYLNCELVEKEGEVYTIKSDDVSIVVELSNQVKYSSITQITCNLNRENHSISQLGNLIITNQGNVSVWDLDKLYKNNL